MKKILIISGLLLLITRTTSAQYTAAKDAKATANPVKAAKPDASRAFAGQTCGDLQQLFCEGIQHLQYKVCMVKGVDLNTAQKVNGQIQLVNGETDKGNYYITLYYSWKGTNISEQNVKVPAGGSKAIAFSMNAQSNYTGSINNVQVWVKDCRKIIDP